ncbi:MAG: hypothetical protein U9Q03_02615 [Patescibacteria group bacterium]|nr:hypothetical protein [Patescibacteria group bacterium]
MFDTKERWTDKMASFEEVEDFEWLVRFAPKGHHVRDEAADRLFAMTPLKAHSLQIIVRYCEDERSDRACKLLLERKYLKELTLRTIVAWGGEPYSGQAAARLLEREELDEITVRAIIRHAPEPHKRTAWTMALETDIISYGTPAYVVRYGPETYRELAWNLLSLEDIFYWEDIIYIFCHAPPTWKRRAIDVISSQVDDDETDSTLRIILKRGRPIEWIRQLMLKSERISDLIRNILLQTMTTHYTSNADRNKAASLFLSLLGDTLETLGTDLLWILVENVPGTQRAKIHPILGPRVEEDKFEEAKQYWPSGTRAEARLQELKKKYGAGWYLVQI